MLCNHCNKNEAENRFYVNFMGQVGEVNLCTDCLDQIMRFAGGMYRGFQQSAASSAPDGLEADLGMGYPEIHTRAIGEDRYPTDAGAQIKHRRRLAELRGRMEEAISREDYEMAARLRDEICNEEKGVRIYDT